LDIPLFCCSAKTPSPAITGGDGVFVDSYNKHKGVLTTGLRKQRNREIRNKECPKWEDVYRPSKKSVKKFME